MRRCAEGAKAKECRCRHYGHSLSQDLKEQITAAAKARRLPVVVLHFNPHEPRIQLADANLCGIDGAATIVEIVSCLLP